jgi:RNA polymerase sigma-B factor
VDKTAGNGEISSAPEVTARLLRQYHLRGDSSARDRLVELYMPLVGSVAKRYARGGEDYEDLVQVGSIGLMKAIDRFDLNRGSELASFAVPTISGEIKRHLRDRGETVRLPRGLAELRGRVGGAREDLTARLGREPSAAELASELDADEDAVTNVLSALRGVAASEPDPDAAVASDAPEDRLALMEAFDLLDERERRIVYMRFVQDLDPDEIARELGISKRHLSRQTRAALEKLRRGLEGGQPEAPQPKLAEMEPVTAYLDRPYHIVVVRNDDGWVASVEELPGCEAHAATSDEAMQAIHGAMETWIAEALEQGREVPEPRGASTYSGRLMLRMPHSLHAELARAAERDEVSLNQFITSSLASVVGWRRMNGEVQTDPLPAEPAEQAAPARGRRRLLLLNAVLLGIVGIAAVVLLVVALTQGS